MPAEFRWTPEARGAALAAYEDALTYDGGVDAALDAAAEVQPVVDAPKCPECKGTGDSYAFAPMARVDGPCPRCNGSGVDPFETPLHELCELARQLGLHVDFGIYADGGVYEGGSRVTGAADPMDSIRAGVRSLRARLDEREAS